MCKMLWLPCSRDYQIVDTWDGNACVFVYNQPVICYTDVLYVGVLNFTKEKDVRGHFVQVVQGKKSLVDHPCVGGHLSPEV